MLLAFFFFMDTSAVRVPLSLSPALFLMYWKITLLLFVFCDVCYEFLADPSTYTQLAPCDSFFLHGRRYFPLECPLSNSLIRFPNFGHSLVFHARWKSAQEKTDKCDKNAIIEKYSTLKISSLVWREGKIILSERLKIARVCLYHLCASFSSFFSFFLLPSLLYLLFIVIRSCHPAIYASTASTSGGFKSLSL